MYNIKRPEIIRDKGTFKAKYYMHTKAMLSAFKKSDFNMFWQGKYSEIYYKWKFFDDISKILKNCKLLCILKSIHLIWNCAHRFGPIRIKDFWKNM